MDTSLLQTILYIISVVMFVLMLAAFGIACFASNEKRKDNGLSIGFVALFILLVVAAWAGFNNYRAFEPERSAVINKVIDCESVKAHTDTRGFTYYVVIIDGKEYPVEIKVLSPSK